MKKLYFGSNLKMYKTAAQTQEYLQQLANLTAERDREKTELFIIPSYTSLPDAVKTVRSDQIILGAQNMCWEEEGQFTGEISPLMLKELGIRLVMIGHSERRHVFGETDQEENEKVKAALNHGMTALLCIGETGEQREYGVSEEALRTQLKIGLHNVAPVRMDQLWIAYEPVWSIGVNGIPASAEYAEKMHRTIKDMLGELFGGAGSNIPVLYGGSVNSENACELITLPSVDGLFVGRSAWQAADFNTLIRAALSAADKSGKLRTAK